MINFHFIVLDIKDKIISGEWLPYTKIPTQKELSQKYGVNRSTIVKAIDELKSDGYLFGKQGSGTFVSPEFSTLKLRQRAKEWENISKWSFYSNNKSLVRKINEYETNPTFIQLSKGVLGREYIPERMINEAIHNVSFKNLSHDYGDGRGDIELRKELTKYLKKKGIKTSYESIIIVSGALNGIQLIVSSILQTGSIIYNDNYSFLNTLNFFHSLGIRASNSININNSLSQQDLKSNQTLYINSPFQNPTTYTLSNSQKEEIINTTNEKNIAVIEDNIYGDLVYEGHHKPLKLLDENGNIIYVSSFSKTLSPSLRIGWIVAAPEIIKKISDVRMHTDYGTSNITQAVCTELLKSGAYENHLNTLREQLKQKRDYFDSLLKEYLDDYGTWFLPEGGFFIWYTFHPDLEISLKKLFYNCIKEKVLFNPGMIYGVDDNQSIRFSFAYEGEEKLRRGMIILAQQINSLIAK